LVEIGAGGGEFLRLLQLNKRFSEIKALDIATLGAEKIIDAPVPDSAPILFQSANLSEDWPIDDSSVDFLVAMMVIEHLFDPFHSFSEIHRVLRSDGVAFINLPLVTGIRNRIRLLLGGVPVTSSSYCDWFEKRAWDGGHLHYFSIAAIRELAARSGLEMLDISAVGRGHKVKSIFPSLLASEITFAVRRRR
jgi:SAM-dependent methyltransferase